MASASSSRSQGATRRHTIYLPLVGDFQASNALVAAGLVHRHGRRGSRSPCMRWNRSRARKGRLDLVGTSKAGAPIFVDYAHTPDALENAIAALAALCRTDKLVVVFGCGGDRDKGKRPQMGAIAAKLADRVYVTDDNPRSEDAGRRSAPRSWRHARARIEIGDRAEAIRAAVDSLEGGRCAAGRRQGP